LKEGEGLPNPHKNFGEIFREFDFYLTKRNPHKNFGGIFREFDFYLPKSSFKY